MGITKITIKPVVIKQSESNLKIKMGLIEQIENLKRREVSNKIKERIYSFKSFNRSSSQDLFSELSFCILTANFSALGGIKIQKELGKKFLTLKEEELAQELKKLGHRFPNTRAKYIVEAREKLPELIEKISAVKTKKDEKELREWIVKNVKGIGYKEASHFLRNIGFENLAIIDFHIADILEANGIIKKPKTMTKKAYLNIEKKLEEISEKTKLPLGELDLYLWYLETGKVFK